ncbi:DUF5337 domain-containing protein [Thalassovita taeanensis]|uniref:DUF5337 domain-containing protein n=1 Tax=Thalassovita taeanensis TaxID=657014 RepID=A0A1H9FP29_9RHOB|nr:DUF5337 domain-containing protein [Thalassovita taeanensis]SEQ39632.1 hypothetical protein SAMN04488092_106161 [Thalassovita taeanensis]
MADELDAQLARKGRTVAVVIAGAMVLWLGLNFLGQQLGWPQRFAFLFDFAAIAALIWALVVTFQIRRARRDSNTNGQR